MTDKQPTASDGRDEARIFFIRGQKVMLGMHLAEIYGVGPQALDQVVERNIGRFPEGSVFRLNPEEVADLKSQLAMSCQAAPYAFTGQGVVMFSEVLLDASTMPGNQESCAPTCSCHK